MSSLFGDPVIIKLPRKFTFAYKGSIDCSWPLSIFNWELKSIPVIIDFTNCFGSNYQTISLMVLYVWHLKRQGCTVTIKHGSTRFGPGKMWRLIGAMDADAVLLNTSANFRYSSTKPLFAVRGNEDLTKVLAKAEEYTQGIDVEYKKTLRHVISELLYNTYEHGYNQNIPSIIQITWYREKGELSFIIADLGMGIRRHLRQAYPLLESHKDAIEWALKHQVSGTFGNKNSYQPKDNAGIGLYLSHNIIKRLHADMYVVSGDGLVHVSPMDVTKRTIKNTWQGTFVYVSIKVDATKRISLEKMLAEFQVEARQEQENARKDEQQQTLYFNVSNHFHSHAEDKVRAARIRDKVLMPAVMAGKAINIDFEGVVMAPHSFLSALLAMPIQTYGMASWKKIKVINADPAIKQTIEFIMDENTTLD